MSEAVDTVKYPCLPSNYVSIAHLQERWLKEKQRKQEENAGVKQYAVTQNHKNRIADGCSHSGAPVGKNHIVKGWREMGLIGKEPKLKEVEISVPVVDGTKGKKKKKIGYFGKRKPRVERDVGVEEMSVENGGKESSKGKCKEVEQVATVCRVEVVGESNVDREIEGQKCGVGYRGEKRSGRRMGDGVGEVSDEADNEKVRMGGAFCAYGNKEVASVCTVEVVGERNVDREIAGQKCGVGFRGKKHSGRKMGDRVGEVSDKVDSGEQSGEKHNAEKEKVSVDVKERTNEKVRTGGAFCAYGYKEVASVCTVEVVGETKVDREIVGKKCGVGFRGKKNSGRKMGDSFGVVSHKADGAELSGQEHNTEKVRMGGVFHAHGDTEVEEVATVCAMEGVGENNVHNEITRQKCRVGFKGKKNYRRRMGDGIGQVSDKMDSGEQSGKQHNAEKEKVSVDVKERTDEKVKVSGAFRAYGDKEVDEVATVCMVEVVEENKVDREIAGQKCRVGYKGNKYSWRKIGDGIGELSDKANSAEQSGQECNAEKEKVSIDVKERTNEKVRVRGAFRAYGDKSKDVPIDSEAGLKMTIERDLGNLSLTDRRYGHERSSDRVYGDKWRYGSSKRCEPRKILKQRDNNFVWIKKGESSNGNVAEIETQVSNYAGFPV